MAEETKEVVIYTSQGILVIEDDNVDAKEVDRLHEKINQRLEKGVVIISVPSSMKVKFYPHVPNKPIKFPENSTP